MKYTILAIMSATLLILNTFVYGQTNVSTLEKSTPVPSNSLVIVIPIEGMIERGLLYVIRRSLEQAVNEKATAVILDMNTPGGRVDVTEDIMRLLIDLPDTITTYTYVNKDALSAGALITISTDRIYMAPGSRIGASAIVGATGDIEDGDLKEKHVSALVALARSAAETKLHDPDLIEAMIRKDMTYSIGEEVICKEGQLLTLTERDASRIIADTDGHERTLLAVGTVDTLDALLEAENLHKSTVRTIRLTHAERIARYIELFSFIFLAAGLLGIYIEFKTPGFGLPGILGGVMLAIFFWGHRIVGLSGDIELVLFALGLILLLVELLVIPGFGVTGIAGIGLILLSVFFSMIRPTPGAPWFQLPPIQLEHALQNLGASLALAFAFGMLATRFLPKTKTFQHLMLNTDLANVHDAPITTADEMPVIGMTGTAITALRPAGYASVNERRVGVVASGEFIEQGDKLVISDVRGNRIIVEKTSQG